METEEPMTDEFSPEYVKEEIAKLMAYKIQAYEQLKELTSLREQLDEANKLIMDIQASWQQLNELTPELEERISRLLLTSAK